MNYDIRSGPWSQIWQMLCKTRVMVLRIFKAASTVGRSVKLGQQGSSICLATPTQIWSLSGWTVGELNAILENNLVPSHGGLLSGCRLKTVTDL